MKKATFAIVFSAFLSTQTTYATPITHMEDIASFQSSIKKNASLIWPNLLIGNRPFVYAGKQGDSLYAFDLSSPNTAWQNKIIAGVPVSYMEHDSIGAYDYIKSESLGKFTTFKVDNKSAIIMLEFSDNDTAIDKMLMAGYYYYFYELMDSPNASTKAELFKQLLSRKQLAYDDFNHAESFALLILETSALKDYLDTHNEDTLKTFTAIYQTRNKLLDDGSKAYDQQLDVPFPMDYIMARASNLNDPDFLKAMLENYNNNIPDYVTHPCQNPTGCDMVEPKFLRDDYQDMQSFITIATQYAMDNVYPEWKSIVENKSVGPESLFLQRYQMSDAEIQARTEAAKARYGYSTYLSMLNNSLTPYLASMEKAEAEYAQSSGVEFVIKANNINSTDASFGGNNYIINSQTQIVTDSMGLDYTLSGNSNKLSLSSPNLSLYYLYDPNAAQAMKFKVTADCMLTIDGQAIPLQQFITSGTTRKFNQLTITGNGQSALNVTVSVDQGTATLSVVNGQIVLEFDNQSSAKDAANPFVAASFLKTKKHR